MSKYFQEKIDIAILRHDDTTKYQSGVVVWKWSGWTLVFVQFHGMVILQFVKLGGIVWSAAGLWVTVIGHQ